MNWIEIIRKVAPTLASAFLGPLGGTVVTAVGEILSMAEPTTAKIQEAIENGSLTGEQISGIRQLELKLKSEESERGFKYAELEFKDRDSARNMNIQTGAKTPAVLTWIIVAIVLGLEGMILFNGMPVGVSEIVTGRILGTLDMSLMMVLAFWFGTTYGSGRKTDLLNTK